MGIWLVVKVLIIVGVLAMGILVSPNHTIALSHYSSSKYDPIKLGTFKLIHILTFGTAWGISLWNTFLADFMVHK